ncbi:MAG: glycosyltransferase family 4 protein [Paludibacteraceae bacterium]|nr:glycosyltransferase family 4 protein [Paludibacteraceae bacterium]
MKVAYLLGSLNRGGTETLLLDCFQNSAQPPYNMMGIYRKEGILSSSFKQTKPKLLKLSPHCFFDIRYLFRLRKILKQEQIDIVHAQQALDALYAKLALIGCHKKIILTFHGFDFTNKILDKIIYRLIIKSTDCNIFVSNTQKEYYIKKYKLNSRRQQVVYNGISFSKFATDSFLDIRKELNIEPAIPLFATVGNFVAGRDQLSVCSFLNELNQQGVDFRFLFIGKKNEAEPWRFDNCIAYCKQQNLSDKIFFLGGRDDVPAILSQLDAFVYSSEYDTFGIAVIEAIASGIPVFVNDWDVMQEITENGKLAILYKTKDENDLNRKFMHYMQNKSLYLEQAKQSAIEVKQKFSIENHINSLYSLYQFINANK